MALLTEWAEINEQSLSHAFMTLKTFGQCWATLSKRRPSRHCWHETDINAVGLSRWAQRLMLSRPWPLKKIFYACCNHIFLPFQALRNDWCGGRLKIWASWQSIFFCLLVDKRPISAILTIISLFACQWHPQATISVSLAKKPYQTKLKLPKRNEIMCIITLRRSTPAAKWKRKF